MNLFFKSKTLFFKYFYSHYQVRSRGGHRHPGPGGSPWSPSHPHKEHEAVRRRGPGADRCRDARPCGGWSGRPVHWGCSATDQVFSASNFVRKIINIQKKNISKIINIIIFVLGFIFPVYWGCSATDQVFIYYFYSWIYFFCVLNRSGQGFSTSNFVELLGK